MTLKNYFLILFTAEVSKSTLTTTTGTQIYQVDVTDAENDALQYTMSCSPSTCPFTMNENSMYLYVIKVK